MIRDFRLTCDPCQFYYNEYTNRTQSMGSLDQTARGGSELNIEVKREGDRHTYIQTEAERQR